MKPWLILLIFAAFACSDEGDASSRTPTASGGSPGLALSGPPAAMAAFGGTSVPMGTGTHCWSPAGICRDAAGPITGAQELTVAAGSKVEVRTGFPATSVVEVQASAYPAAGTPSATTTGELVWNFPPVGGQQLNATFDSNGGFIEAPAVAGRYVVTVFLRVPEGDVSYGVVLDVK